MSVEQNRLLVSIRRAKTEEGLRFVEMLNSHPVPWLGRILLSQPGGVLVCTILTGRLCCAPALGIWEQWGSCGKEFRDGDLGARDGRMWVKQLQLWKILDAYTEENPPISGGSPMQEGSLSLLHGSAWRTEKVLEHLC